MDEGRIGFVKRQEDKHRKFACILNDIIRSQDAEYQNILKRERHEMTFKYFKNSLHVKQSLARQNILQKCLAMRRRAASDEPRIQMFGQYGGMPLHGFHRDVEQYIKEMHPKMRRLRKVQKMLRKSKEEGAILDESATVEKIEDFFGKLTNDLFNVKKTQVHHPQDGDDESESREVNSETRKSRDYEARIAKRGLSRHYVSERNDETDGTKTKLNSRPALVLPPISSSKALVQH